MEVVDVVVVVAAEAARHLRAAEHPHAVELGGGADPQLRVEEAGLHEGLGGERGGERGGCVAGRGRQGGMCGAVGVYGWVLLAPFSAR